MLNSKLPWFISYFGVTVTTIYARFNIKEENYMWGSHLQKDSDHHGGTQKVPSDDVGWNTTKTITRG